MHQYLDIARGLSGHIAAVAVVAVVVVAACEARTAAPSPVEAGYPYDLINTAACAVDERFDEGSTCSAAGWPEGRSLYRPIR